MNYVYKLLKGYAIAFMLFFILTVILAFLIKFTSVPENFSIYYLLGAMCLAALFLGIFSGRLIGKRGLLWAAALSSVFVFLLIFAINCIYFQDLSINTFRPSHLFPVAIGGIGGIIGVNVKK